MSAVAEQAEAKPRKREVAPYQAAIQKAKERFAKIASETVDYERESVFAMQALMKTSFAMETANKNPQSVHLSMINVASTGLTLNPAHGYAYLVPRDGAIVLDISYKGLIKIATDTGAVRWARADLVFAKDEFTYNGPAQAPEHKANPFGDRGEIVGVYCIAKTSDGDILTEIMPLAELEKIRGKSMAYAKKKSGPWVEWFEQMAKKAVIKRASKTWPYTDRAERLMDAIELANQTEGGYDLEAEAVRLISDGQAQKINAALEATDIDPAPLLALFDIEEIAALPAARYVEFMKTIEDTAHARS